MPEAVAAEGAGIPRGEVINNPAVQAGFVGISRRVIFWATVVPVFDHNFGCCQSCTGQIHNWSKRIKNRNLTKSPKVNILKFVSSMLRFKVGPKSVRSRPRVGPRSAQGTAHGRPRVDPKSAQSRPNGRSKVGPRSAQSWPRVGLKSAQSQPKVAPKSAQSRPKVGPESA